MINQISDLRLRETLNNMIDAPNHKSADEIIQSVIEYKLQTSCDAAAIRYFAIIAHICYFREDLETALLKIALRPLYYYGIEGPEIVISWVKSNIKVKSFWRRASVNQTTVFGDKWIKTRLIKKRETIMELIDEIVREDEESPFKT